MKSFLKAIIGIILIIFFIGLITFTVDNARIGTGKTPVASILVHHHKDGGTKEYYGIGYKIIAYNKLNGYKKSHIGTYNLQYDSTLGEESELADISKQSIEKMNGEKLKDTVEFTSKEIKNKDKFLSFLDSVAEKDVKRHELNFITTTIEGDDIKHTLVYENNAMFYTVDRRSDKFAGEQERKAPLTYEVEALIKQKQSEDKKKNAFYVVNKLTEEDILLVEVLSEHLKLKGE